MILAIIPEECINCGACINECPDGIFERIDGTVTVDEDGCSNYASCVRCVDTCPNDAIVEIRGS